jgi:hypothetical protein
MGQLKKNKDVVHLLKNKNLEIEIDLPLANYNFSRFDWTGKISSVKYKGIYVSGVERLDTEEENKFGKGFYNEFGIDEPLAYDETKPDEWFHKIGVGALKRDNEDYLFSKNYQIQAADFEVTSDSNKISIVCTFQDINGYSYMLKKVIELLDNGFVIHYLLKNTGSKTIATNEYTHNFLAINHDLIGSEYILKFPFPIHPESFGKTVNPEGKVEIGKHEVTFNDTPEEQFFFSQLSGNMSVDASWELINTKNKIGIRETGSFKTSKVNLWGWKHVVCPELFFDVLVQPGKTIEWSRTYDVFDIN